MLSSASPTVIKKVGHELMAETVFQLAEATDSENPNPGAVKVCIAILQAAVRAGDQASRLDIQNELAEYCIPLSALQIGTEEGLDL